MTDVDRRQFVIGSAGAVVAGAALGCKRSAPDGEPAARPPMRGPANPALVRVASVPTAVEGNV